MGADIDHFINNDRGPYQYRKHVININRFGILKPIEEEQPKFCHLYIFDTENEVGNRMRALTLHDTNIIYPNILENLVKMMLDMTNELVKYFRMARDRLNEEDIVDLRIVMKASRSTNGRENRMTPSNEVAAVIVGDNDET